MKEYIIKNKKNDEVVDVRTLELYIFPVSATPLIHEIKKIAEFQNEISEKYYKEPSVISNENEKKTIQWILSYYSVPDKD
jgi:hypothetical protein